MGAGALLLGLLVALSAAGQAEVRLDQSAVPVNYTALWWNPAESGWGLNLVQQGDTAFGTLFIYDIVGVPMWLSMSEGKLQPDGATFKGTLYLTHGPVFNAVPFTPITFPANYMNVGTMQVAFSDADKGTLSYFVNGVSATKSIRKFVYGTRAPTCAATTSDRSSLTNYQDLWWKPTEGGWGVNVVHQDDTLFATLFTYDADGHDTWLVMSNGALQPDGSYLGDLHQTTGPPLTAMTFTPLGPANYTKVGTMRFRFSDGDSGTLTYAYNNIVVTKSITRTVFALPVTACH